MKLIEERIFKKEKNQYFLLGRIDTYVGKNVDDFLNFLNKEKLFLNRHNNGDVAFKIGNKTNQIT